MDNSFYSEFLDTARREFLQYRRLGREAMGVLSDAELNSDPHASNSVAVIVRHLHGNMRSRWTNFFTEDGEKPDRDRDSEFDSIYLTKSQLAQLYDEGWTYLESALSSLTAEDFTRPVVIRNESLTLIQAIGRQLTHYAYHVGQIVFIAKQFKGLNWKSLSIPKGKSVEHSQGKYLKK